MTRHTVAGIADYDPDDENKPRDLGATIDAVRELSARGYGHHQIASALGVAVGQVRNILAGNS
jgi:hypothetical protein